MADIEKFNSDELSRLLKSEAVALSVSPLFGMLLLTTDQGSIRITINEGLATQLIEELEAFLNTEGTDEGEG
jgi:hypothetical protein